MAWDENRKGLVSILSRSDLGVSEDGKISSVCPPPGNDLLSCLRKDSYGEVVGMDFCRERILGRGGRRSNRCEEIVFQE